MNKKTTDEKIVELVQIALEKRDAVMIWKLADILNKRGDFENKMNTFLEELNLIK
jgi:hypothetical protein